MRQETSCILDRGMRHELIWTRLRLNPNRDAAVYYEDWR